MDPAARTARIIAAAERLTAAFRSSGLAKVKCRRAVADALGVHPTTLSRWTTGALAPDPGMVLAAENAAQLAETSGVSALASPDASPSIS